MVQLIIGDKGKGKTKQLLDKGLMRQSNPRTAISYFLIRVRAHMYELNNRIRLIDVSGFPLKAQLDEFVGFYLWDYLTGSRSGRDVY